MNNTSTTHLLLLLLVSFSSALLAKDTAPHSNSNNNNNNNHGIIKYPKQAGKQPLPEFVLTPSSELYVLKTKPLTLICRARFASSIQVFCGGEELDQSRLRSVAARTTTSVRTTTTTTRLTSSASSQADEFDDVLDLELLDLDLERDSSWSEHMTEVQWNVTVSDVEEDGGTVDQPDYTCECVAWRERDSSILPVRSNLTRIYTAYLKKNFQMQPIHLTVTANAQVELPCMPPEGKPTPEIQWLKNGKLINPQADVNVLIGGYGSLMINQARESDTGSYVCVAQNVAGRKLSDAANLTVTVNGRWSDWTPWNPPTCPSKCVAGPVIQSRSRVCLEPKNGGTPCNGSSVERRFCPSMCTVHGDWGDWSDWQPSNCDRNCKQYRVRACDNPAPFRGGSECHGSGSEERHCEGCVVATEVASLVGAVDMPTLMIYIAIAFAVAIAFTATVAVYCLRKRRLHAAADSFSLYDDAEAKHVPCIAFRKSSRTKELHSSEMQTQSIRLLNSGSDSRSPATINLSVTGGRSDLAQLSTSNFSHPECGRSTTYLTSLTPTRSVRIASTQMPLLQQSVGQPYTIESKLGSSVSDLKVHSGFSSPHTYQSLALPSQQATLTSATLSLPPPPPNVANSPQCGMHAPLTTNMVNYHDCVMMKSFVLRPADNACESTVTCTSVNERTSCDEDVTSRATPYCATSQCESACACEHDGPYTSSDHQYAYVDHLKNCSNLTRLPDQCVSQGSQYTTQTRAAVQKRSSLLLNSGANESKVRATVSVCVPDGALLPTCATIGVAAIHDDADRPHLRNEQTFLSAVAQLRCTSGHRAATLVKTVVISFQHCAVLGDEWLFTLYFTHDGDSQSSATWHSVPIDRENGCAQINESGAVICCQLDATRCYVVTNRLGRYALVGEPVGQGATKSLRLAAFSTVLSAAAYEHTVRVYVLDDTLDALQNVLDAERTVGGCLLDSPKQLAFKHASQQNLRVLVETLSLGWRTKSRVANCQQEIPFSHIWAGTQTRLHCSFMFERCGKEELAGKLLCKLTAFQSDGTQQAVLNVAQECCANVDDSRLNRQDCEPRTHALFTCTSPLISASVRRKLCTLLDLDDAGSCSWKDFAAQLNVGSLIAEQIATLHDTYSPAETLMSVFEAKCVGSLTREEALQEMIALLRRVKRVDCAVLLENELSNKF